MECCGDEQILSETESVCPACLTRIPAQRVQRGENVYLRKNCPDHSGFETIIWRGQPAFSSWVRPKSPSFPLHPFTPVNKGCPFDCGLCADHRQTTCCVLLEVTARCDLRCAFCFASAGGKQPADPSLAAIENWYRGLLDAGGPYNIQLSGGEPCQRNDLPEIIALGRSLGFTFFQVNTNGLRLARDPAYLQRLVAAGLNTVFLQFDGIRDDIHKALRGRNLLNLKQQAIVNCAKQHVGVVLVPTLVPGINTADIGQIVDFALDNFPVVRGVHFQPASYFGRFPKPPTDEDRFTLPEVICAIEQQTHGRIQAGSFLPPGGENALCSFHGNFVVMPDGQLKPLTRHINNSCCQPTPAAKGATRSRAFVAKNWAAPEAAPDLQPAPRSNLGLGGWETFLSRAKTHVFCISGMAFQDAWTLDLERLRDCYIHTASPDGRIIPFCAYNLTDQFGHALYRSSQLAVVA